MTTTACMHLRRSPRALVTHIITLYIMNCKHTIQFQDMILVRGPRPPWLPRGGLPGLQIIERVSRRLTARGAQLVCQTPLGAHTVAQVTCLRPCYECMTAQRTQRVLMTGRKACEGWESRTSDCLQNGTASQLKYAKSICTHVIM